MTPPTLAVEIRSPEQSKESQRAKCRYFRTHGVDVAWLVDPEERTVEVFESLDDGSPVGLGQTLRSAHLPGFELALDVLFAAMDQ